MTCSGSRSPSLPDFQSKLPLERFLAVWCARGSQGLQAEWLKPHERAGANPGNTSKYAGAAKAILGAMRFFDWELRPAVVEGGSAWSILAPGEDWTEVNSAEVIDSGRVMEGEDAMREAFSRTFPELTDLPIAASQYGESPEITSS